MRIEAGALDGRPVYFETLMPDDPEWSAEAVEADRRPTALERVQEISVLTVIVGLFAGACVLARRNWKLGRGDRRGALRLAAYVFALRLLHWLVAGHHVFEPGEEFGMVLSALASALLLAAVTWVPYMAIEPYFRRLWPEALVSWTRLLSGRLRDPLVGRDLLIGFAAGIGLLAVTTLAHLAPGWLGAGSPNPLMWAITSLEGGRRALGSLFLFQLESLPAPLAFMALFLLLRILLRRQWAAAIAFTGLFAVLTVLEFVSSPEQQSGGVIVVGLLLGILQAVLLLVVVLRFGVLAAVGTFMMSNLLAAFPIAADPAAPFFATGIGGLVFAAALAVWAFYVSLAGRPLFHDAILPAGGGVRS
jgi:serine/threonine-protein kinase